MSEIRNKILSLKNYMETRIIGQEELVKKLLITLLAVISQITADIIIYPGYGFGRSEPEKTVLPV